MLALYNPHSHDFIFRPLAFLFVKRKALCKYGYIKDTILTNEKCIRIYVDFSESSIIPMGILLKLPLFLRKMFITLELIVWARLNEISDKIIYISDGDDFSMYKLLGFSYKSATNDLDGKIEKLKKFRKVYLHLSHYLIRTKEKFDIFFALGDKIVLLADSDCSSNDYYVHHLGNRALDLDVLSFLPQDRFLNIKELDDRKNKIIATGSFHDLYQETPVQYYHDYLSFYNRSSYHYVRKDIYEKNNNEVFTCHVSPYRSSKRKFSAFNISQKSYFSFDIVEAYNSHKFAVIGDDIVGLPSIGTLEAMACGCVVFAVPQCLQGLEMVPYVHYLPYNGSYDDLLFQYSNYSNDEELLNIISKNAVDYIKDFKIKNILKIVEFNND